MGRLKLAMRVLFNKAFADSVSALNETAKLDPPKVESTAAKDVAPPQPKKPARSDAITLLATLQREARLIDFLQEDISGYSDAEIGAAVRDVHRESGKVLQRLVALKPVVNQDEDTQIDVPKDPAGRYKLSGNISGEASRGTLVHSGWEAAQCELPAWTGSDKAAMIIAPAEVEI